MAGNKGSADLVRDVRGFAVKLYTKEGNWDIVGNNIPVFFIQDAIKFPDVVHAVKQEPDRGFPQAATAHDNFWDFISLTPESMHMVMWIMSDRTIPRSFRFMEGFGVHTFRLINTEGKSTFVKFHWKPKLGLQAVVWNEAGRSTALILISIAAICGTPSRWAPTPNGNLACSSSMKNSLSDSTSMCSMRPRLSRRRRCYSARWPTRA